MLLADEFANFESALSRGPLRSEQEHHPGFGHCSITPGLEFPAFREIPRDTPFATPLYQKESSMRSRYVITSLACLFLATPSFADEPAQKEIRIGIIGVDTSHAVEFTRLFNDDKNPDRLKGGRVVAAYPHGSKDIPSSTSRIVPNTEKIAARDVKIVSSIEELLPLVDAVLLETNDGRPHLEQARLVIKAGKTLFVDKPVAASLKETGMLLQEAHAANVPVFSSSSLRYSEDAQAARAGKFGKVYGCDAFSPESREATHPSLFWYGIHGVETLFTVMGPGCESVTRVETETSDVVVGRWKDGRIGTFRGLRSQPKDGPKIGYGGTIFASKANQAIGPFKGYRPLLVEIDKFFHTGKSPVALRETLEIYAFMEAADESTRQGGKPVSIADTLKAAGLDPNLFEESAAAAK